jgi:hypothetical protein
MLLAGALLFGAAAADEPTVTRLDMGVQYVDEDNQPLPETFYSNQVTLFFPYIPGQLFGNPRGGPLFVVRTGEDLAFELDLGTGLEEIGNGATPLSPAAARQGLSVEPPSVAIARLGTFAYDTETEQELGAGGFIDAASRDSLILIYASAACRITGSLAVEGTQFDHAIELPAGGFHWVRVRSQPDGRYRLTRHPPDGEVFFAIYMLDLGRT